jgi:hypothetical protein
MRSLRAHGFLARCSVGCQASWREGPEQPQTPSTLAPTAGADGARTFSAPIGTPLEHIAGALWTSVDSHGLGVSHDGCICREIMGSPSSTRLTRNEGVPGSSPGVGFSLFAGIFRVGNAGPRGSGTKRVHLLTGSQLVKGSQRLADSG